jgi:trans-2,3-dihydro-3-hydroxyanthranilate isomerase
MPDKSSARSYQFFFVDVFTDVPLAGNPLPVVLDADGLDGKEMQAIAREFNASETTFVLPPRAPRATRRLRCFSPSAEVFGAGHNALGAWWVIALHGGLALEDGETTLSQELGDRVLPLDVGRESGTLVRVAMTQAEPLVAAALPDRTRLASALALEVGALTVPDLEPQVISTGATHLLVPVRGLADLGRVRVDREVLTALAKPLGCEGCYLFCLETRERRSTAHARAFFPGIGIAEDPATGSAAGPLGYYLAAHGLVRQDEWITVEQGDEIGRPSRIEVRISGSRVQVAGRCAIVAEGHLTL